MPTSIDSDTVKRLLGSIASNARDSDTQFSADHCDVVPPAQESSSNPRSAGDDPPMSSGFHPASFDEHSNETPRWKMDLDDHFTNIFDQFVFSEYPIDDMVARALQIIGSPTQAKIRGIALVLHTHWTRMQFRCKDANVSALEIVSFISRLTDHLGRMSVHAQKDFLDELNCLCIEKLKLTWRWYVAIVIRQVLPIPRKTPFMRVMAVVAMITHLFRGGQLRYGAALDGLGYVATMSPWPDAVAIIYALLHGFGPKFALEQPGWHFVQCLLTELFPLAAGRVCVDPLYQLVSAINTLVTEWHNGARVTFYHAYSKGSNQLRAL